MKLITAFTVLTAVLAAPLAAPAPDAAPAVQGEGPASATYSAILSIVAKQSSKFSHHQKRDVDEKNRYIVTFDDNATLDQIGSEMKKLDSLVDKDSSNSGITSALDLDTLTDGSGFIGFIGKFSPSIVDKLKESSILTVEEDANVPQEFLDFESESDSDSPISKRDMETSEVPNWGLSRISHKNYQKDGKWTYTRETEAKHPTVVYVCDSGVRTTHEMFEGRAVWGANFCDDIDEDEMGHGTHVAGTVGGKDYGVDENTKIVSVKVFAKGKGVYLSQIVGGFTWSLNDFIKNRDTVSRGVLNYSGYIAMSDSVKSVLTRAVQENMVVTTIANNFAKDACDYSPAYLGAKTPGLITVAALEEDETAAPYTNFGSCVDVWGPGSRIDSASHTSDTGIAKKSGTSMAAPHVAGLATYYMSTSDKDLTPAEVEDLITKSNTGVLTFDLKGSPNAVAYNGNGL